VALTITITNPRTIAIIERQAAERGVSESDMVAAIVDDALIPDDAMPAPRPETPEEREARFTKARALITEMQSMMTDEDRAFDYDAWLYDENGLPH
jgi:hypothetical protein